MKILEQPYSASVCLHLQGKPHAHLQGVGNTKHRVLLMTAYGGGLRVAELVHLKPQDIHSERMLIRVNQGKGRKDRYTLLSPRLLPVGCRTLG